MKNASGKIIYVGKAVNLRNRVQSYFMKGLRDHKTNQLVANVVDYEFYLVSTEEEALVLELNLIKKFRPYFNIRLKDDKGFPYLKIDMQEKWPRVQIVRSVSSDGAQYFGPFANQHSIKRALEVVKSLFPFRSCEGKLQSPLRRPCLEHDLKHCIAPCSGKINREEYLEIINGLILFLEGRQKQLEKHLLRQMLQASALQQYERAAWLREQIKTLQQAISWQKMAIKVNGNKDVVAFITDHDQAIAQVFFIREGKLSGRESFSLTGVEQESPSQIMTSFLQQYYSASTSIPPLILLQHPVSEKSILQRWLTSRRGSAVKLRVPKQGPAAELLRIAVENVAKSHEQSRIKHLSQPQTLEAALEELVTILHLPSPPERIEGYDISNTQGTQAVGSMVVFENGNPSPRHYRRFRIKTIEGTNDYAMLSEVLYRRFAHINATSGAKDWAHPDLVLIDGGKGQLSAAHKTMQECGVGGIPHLSLAKKNEEVFLVGSSKSIILPKSSPGLKLLQRIRDEAHRFAIGYHKAIRKRESINSVLCDVHGIGPKRRQALLKRFGAISGVRQASIEELSQVNGITPHIAQSIKQIVG
ncbi:MAG: excinuclease ABC subunit UvrC [Dehalococcoidia bacterium]|nr:excinuclease ABC subunit UvrC [Dehalococcoidia bacterium]